MIDLQSIPWYLPLVLYAETHYRFPFFFSFLKKNEPEILADAPHRLEPGSALPLLILAKDGDRFRSTLLKVNVEIRQASKRSVHENVLVGQRKLDEPLWWAVVPLDVTEWSGWIELHVWMTIERQGRVRTYCADNHRTSSHKPLRVFVSKDPLPRFADLYLGDAHTHSSHTDDQVEFGPPLKASRELCRSMGLSFFCVTDHSYDLDDVPGSYLESHDGLPKWIALQQEIADLNASQESFAIVRGEEVTCRNARGRNVHLLLYGTKRFFPGSGDGAERWLQTRSEHSVREIVQHVGDDVAAYAAHPLESVPFLQWLLLRRGSWSNHDLQAVGLHGLQFANGRDDQGFKDGKDAWVRALLAGERLFAAAGDDAHGNFNRFRQIGIPFFAIKERDDQLFGKMRTGVFLEGPLAEASIIEALRCGRAIVTDGPVVDVKIVNADGATTLLGGAARGPDNLVKLHARSTPEYGELTGIDVLLGETKGNQEKTVVSFHDRMGFEVKREVAVRPLRPSYVRVEVHTSRQNLLDQRSHWCFTNPVWISP